MKTVSTNCFAVLLLFIITATTSDSSAQILSFTGATNGSLNSVAANASGTALSRVNGVQTASSPCGTIFSSSNFSATKSFSSTLSAEEVHVTPNQGYSLNVTGFSTTYHISSSGPALIRFAYSTDGGTTWISQASNNSTRTSPCGKNYTLSWSTSVAINSFKTLIFRVYSFGAKKSSGIEDIANLTINGTVSPTQTSCGLPTGLSATNMTSSSATLSWAAVSGATSYNIHYRVSGTSTWTNTTSSTPSVNVSGLTASTGYEFQVQTVCSGGTSAFSSSSTFTTAATACSVPTGLGTTSITSSSAGLDWNDVSGAISYNIHYRVSGTSTWTNTTSSTSSVSISGLTASTGYEFQVQTVCSGGTSAYSLSSTFTTAASACSVPTGLSSSNVTSSSATLSWAAVSGATSYNIHYRVSGTSTWTNTTSSTSSVSISGLTASTGYEFQVQTVCSGGTSAYSSSSTFTTAATACSVPTGLGTTSITSSSAGLDWNDVSGATSYNIHYRVSGTSTWTNTTSSTSSVSISGLTASTGYEFQVQTVCSGGTSAYSSSSTFTTAASACSVPTGLSSSNVTSSSATLSWAAVSGATSYNIHYRVSGTSTWTNTTSSTSSVSISGLTASTAYEFQVQTVCSGGTSAYSSSSTFTTAATACSVPTGLGTTSITSSSAALDWNDVSGATSYNIHYRVSGTSTWTNTTSSTSSVSISGLTASTGYEFQVQTVCSGGTTSAYSSSATFTTSTVTSTVPTPDHIVVLILENHGYSQIIGSSSAPRINALANDAASALFTQSYAVEHPSQPNYLDLYSGGNQGVTDDNVPSGTVQGNCSTIGTSPFTTPNLGKQLLGKSLSWATYSEDLPCAGFNGATSNNYARKHNPAANWQGSGTNQIPSGTNKPFSSFPTDFTQLPTVCYVVPNQNNDMHDGTVATGDIWMYNNLNNYIQWAKTHNSLFILTFDEDEGSEGNRIVTIFTGSMVAGGKYSNTINHYNVLRTIEDMYGLGYAGKASTVTTITNCWKTAPFAGGVSSSASINKWNATVYPNPATASINFKLNKLPTSRTWIRIYDLTGRLQGQYEFANSLDLRVNTSRLSAGNYYYRIAQDKTVLHSGMFTVSR